MRERRVWTTPFPGVKCTSNCWCDEYLGTAADLIAAGLVRQEQFPGEPGTNKAQRTFYDGQSLKRGCNPARDEGYLCVRRAGNRFQVLKGVPAAVEEERRAVANAARQARVEEDCRRGEAMHTALTTPETPSQFRDLVIQGTATLLDTIRNPIFPGRSGYRIHLDAEDHEELDDAFERVIDVLRNAAISVNRSKVEELAGLRAHARALNDSSLQKFLTRVKKKARNV